MNRSTVVFVFVVMAFSSACGSSSTCDSLTCNGCCSAGVCRSGTQDSACGSRGAACESCDFNRSCQTSGGLNACVLSGSGGGSGGSGGGGAGGGQSGCSGTTCTGCCFNGACQPGNTAAACGKQGAACSACANNQVCKTDQTCGVDPDSNWLVQPTAASVKPTNNGASWDGDGSGPDPQVFLACPATAANFTHQTPEAANTLSPSWSTGGCVMRARDLIQTGFSFRVFDIDIAADDPITQTYEFKLGEGTFVSGTSTQTNIDGLNSITFSFTRR